MTRWALICSGNLFFSHITTPLDPKVIITLGEKGLFYSDGIEEIFIQACAVKAIDTTGAGDAFNGGLAFGLSKKKSLKECLELANKVAGLSTTKLGAGDSMPFCKDLG